VTSDPSPAREDEVVPRHVAALRVHKGFATSAAEDRAAYLKDLRENWQRAESGFSRRLFLGVVVVAVGGLLLVNGVGEVGVLGVTLTDLRPVRYLVPIVLAYLTVEIATTVAAIDLYGEAHAELFRMTYPTPSEHHLADLLTPAGGLLWGSPGASWFERHGRIADFSNGVGMFWIARAMAGLIIGPLAVIGYVVALLLAQLDVGSVLSAVASLGLVVVTAVQTVAWLRGRTVQG
jgi:hypothetical protein